MMLAAEPHAPYKRPPLTKDFLRGEAGGRRAAARGRRSGSATTRSGWRWACRRSHSTRARGSCTTEKRGELSLRALRAGHRLPAQAAPAARRRRSGSADDPHGRGLGRAAVTRTGAARWSSWAPASSAARRPCRWPMRGVEVELVTDEDAPQAARLGADVGERIAAWMHEAGVVLRLGCPVERDRAGSRRGGAGGRGAPRADDRRAGARHRARLALAQAAGLEPRRRPVACDEAGRTSAEGVLAAGDVARLHNPGAGRSAHGRALGRGPVAGRGRGTNRGRLGGTLGRGARASGRRSATAP